MFTCGLELYFAYFTQYRGCVECAIGIENSDKTPNNKVVNFFLYLSHGLCIDSSRDDGMVVRNFRRIKHLFAFSQRLSLDALHEVEVVA